MSDARGPYSISETLFTSGAWSVARATDAEGKPVRLTMLKVPPGLSSEAMSSLAAAMDSAASTGAASPGLLRLLSGGVGDGELWLAESAPSGPSVREAVAAAGPMEAERVVPFLHQVAAALEPLHAAGLAHIWLSPDNVYLEPTALVGGQAWAGVLSTLRQVDPGAEWPGSEYVAPEALTTPVNGTRAEVYSAAALAAFAVTGQAPSAGSLGGMAPALKAALARGLQSAPELRYGSVKEMAVDVTVEQAIAMQDAAEHTAVPAGGDVPDWARDLLKETAARRDSGQPLVDSSQAEPAAGTAAGTAPAPASAAPRTAPAARTAPATHSAPPAWAAPEAPPPIPVAPSAQSPRRETVPAATVHVEKRRPEKPADNAPAFNWNEPEQPRSLLPTIMVVVSILFIVAAIALTLMK